MTMVEFVDVLPMSLIRTSGLEWPERPVHATIKVAKMINFSVVTPRDRLRLIYGDGFNSSHQGTVEPDERSKAQNRGVHKDEKDR